MVRTSCFAVALAVALSAPRVAHAQRPWRAELSLMPVYREQQVEGPARDDRVHREGGVVAFATASRDVLPWLSVGLALGFDAGTSSRVAFARPAADGVARELARVEGTWWELWAGPSVSLRWRALFAEVIWAPLTVRGDPTRTDLVNARGEADGLFLGTPWVSFALAAGAEVPLGERFALVLRVNFRIRYLTSRGGAALEGGQEAGQMHVWPVAGVRLRW